MYQSKTLESNWIQTPTTQSAFQIDELQQGMQWSPMRHQMINTGDVVKERVEWRKKMSDPRHKWHVRDALTRNAIAVNRMRLGPNTRVVPCDTPYPVTAQEEIRSFKNVDVNWS
jgi:hypothetical protein